MIAIRKAGSGDVALMPALEQSAGERFRTMPDLAWLADGENRDLATYRRLVAGGWCWMAEQAGGAPCGFLAAERVEGEVHLQELGVAIDCQGRGTGRALLRTLVAVAREEAIKAVTLTTFRDVPWNAPFYARHGFEILADDALDAMVRSLLDKEAANGLPADRRCAMRLIL